MATQVRSPSSNGIRQNWTPNNGGDHYVEIDEYPSHDSDTSYLGTALNNQNEINGIAAFDITPTSINKVTIYGVTREAGAAGYVYGRTQLDIGGTVYSGSSSNLMSPGNDTTYQLYSEDFLTNPATSSAWTEAEVEQTDGTNDLNGIGLNSVGVTGGEEIRLTQMYAVVDYEVAAAGGFPRHKRGAELGMRQGMNRGMMVGVK